MGPMKILPLAPDDLAAHERLVDFSMRAARQNHPRWLQDRERVLEEFARVTRPEGAARVLEREGRWIAWIAAAPTFPGIWKLHPLLVDPECQGQGAGRILVSAIEEAARERGARVMIVTTGDATEATNLSGIDLYPDVLGHLKKLAPRPGVEGHAVFFWQKVGYALSGVVPDSGGPRIPSFQLVKRLVETD